MTQPNDEIIIVNCEESTATGKKPSLTYSLAERLVPQVFIYKLQ